MADYHVAAEIESQPSCRREAVTLLATVRDVLPRDGERVTVPGCGTSLHMARAFAALRESKGLRHGPISVAQPGRLTRMFGTAPDGLGDDVAATGAAYATSDLDPMTHLVVAQRPAVAHARAKGMDPDRPRSLTRSVVLP